MATTRFVLRTTACLPAYIHAELYGAIIIIGSVLGKINLYYLEGGAAAPQTTNASLAGGVKGNVSWLLGDQSWLGKISGLKPAKENLPACFFHLFSPSLSIYIPSCFSSSTLRVKGMCSVPSVG